MTDYKRPARPRLPTSRTTPPTQPHPPGGGDSARTSPTSTPPTLNDAGEVSRPTDCNCPTGPGIDAELPRGSDRDAGERHRGGEESRSVQDGSRGSCSAKAKAASQDYTRDKYDDAGQAVGGAGRRHRRAHPRSSSARVPCWHCVIECYVCPLLNELHYAEQWLYGDGTLPTDVHNLYDLQYWHTRDKDAKERAFNRIKAVLTRGRSRPRRSTRRSPTNKTLHRRRSTSRSAPKPARSVYDVFLKLIPMHLAIAPPSGLDSGRRRSTRSTPSSATATPAARRLLRSRRRRAEPARSG